MSNAAPGLVGKLTQSQIRTVESCHINLLRKRDIPERVLHHACERCEEDHNRKWEQYERDPRRICFSLVKWFV